MLEAFKQICRGVFDSLRSACMLFSGLLRCHVISVESLQQQILNSFTPGKVALVLSLVLMAGHV